MFLGSAAFLPGAVSEHGPNEDLLQAQEPREMNLALTALTTQPIDFRSLEGAMEQIANALILQMRMPKPGEESCTRSQLLAKSGCGVGEGYRTAIPIQVIG